MTRSPQQRPISIFTALVLLLTASQLSAENAGTGTPVSKKAAYELEEIIVYAQHRAQNQQDVPLAVSALRGKQIKARGRTAIADLAPVLPNMVLVPGKSPNGPALGAQIRGIGQFDFNPAYEPGDAVYVDGVSRWKI